MTIATARGNSEEACDGHFDIFRVTRALKNNHRIASPHDHYVEFNIKVSDSTSSKAIHIMASIGIIGAGIGGLTAATALRQKGFIVRVYEQASHFVPRAGAGFGFSPNGQVCLKSIGIETRQLIHSFDKLVHLNKEGIQKAESSFFREMRQRHGFGMGGCLRADLVDTLKDSLLDDQDNILQYSHKLVSMTQDDECVCLQFENGKKQEHDFVIGADGIHSSVAKLLEIDDSPPIYSDANIFYGVIEEPDEGVLQEIGLEPRAVVQVSAIMNVVIVCADSMVISDTQSFLLIITLI